MKKIIFGLLFFIFSCSSQKQEGGVLTIHLGENVSDKMINSDFVLNDVFDSVSFVQLEESDSSGAVAPILYSVNHKGDLCFVDQSNNLTINIHDKDGRRLSYFNRKGHGEGEYTDTQGLVYEGEDEVKILSVNNQVIYSYSKDGGYLSKIPAKGIINFAPIGNGRYLAIVSETMERGITHHLQIIDSNGEVCEKLLPLDTAKKEASYYHIVPAMVRVQDGYNFTIQTTSNGVQYYHFNMTSEELTLLCQLDFGKYSISVDNFANSGNPNDFILMVQPFVIGNYLFVSFLLDSIVYMDLYNFTTGDIIARRTNALEKNRLDYMLPNGKPIELNLFSGETFAHNDCLIFRTGGAIKIAESGVENINPEGGQVMVIAKIKK